MAKAKKPTKQAETKAKPVKKAVKKTPKKDAKPKVAATEVKIEAQTVADPSVSEVPKNFILKCSKCQWSRTSSGITTDLADLVYVKPNCASCGKWRRYRCPTCGTICMLKRIKGNV